MNKSQEFKMNQLAPPLSLLSDQNGKIPYPSYTSTSTNLDNGFDSELYHEQIITHLRK